MSKSAFDDNLPVKSSFRQRYSVQLLLFACAGMACWPTLARSQAANEHDAKLTPTVLAPVVVNGAAPGPALWKVSSGDHVLWILGVAEPLPKKVKWNSAEVERIIAESQEVIGPVKGRSGIKADLLQAIDIRRAHKLPDGGHLADVLSKDKYANWLAVKAQYAGQSNSIERLRPRFAARKLYEDVYDGLGLTLRDDVWRTVQHLAKKYKVRIKISHFRVLVENPDDAIDKLNNAAIKFDMPCFDTTLAALDNHAKDVVARANAWAEGDMDVLRHAWVSPQTACASVLTHMPGVSYASTEVAQRTTTVWADDADEALRKNRISFGIQPMGELFKADGRLAILRSRGYVVEQPR